MAESHEDRSGPESAGPPVTRATDDARPSPLHAHAALIRSLAWPIVVLVLVAILANPVRSFIGALEKISLSGHGIQLNLESAKDRATNALIVATDHKRTREGTAASAATPASVERSIDKIVDARGPRLSGTRILWIDDHPENNDLERKGLHALGAEFTNVTSNATARDILQHSTYQVVISDMSRDGDGCGDNEIRSADQCAKCEPFRLLEWMVKEKSATPFIFYTSQKKTELCKAPALANGALGVSGEPAQLLELLTRAIAR